MSTPFSDRLIAATREFGPLCVGIDPHEDLLPDLFGPVGPQAATRWGLAIIERCKGRVGVVKPQSGLFERWGSKGMIALEKVCEAATKAGLVVILDAKRGDIGSTAVGYAEGYLGADSLCLCDAITLNPYMGAETIEPFVDVAERNYKGVAVLARTSNPGSKDFQTQMIDGSPLYMHVARSLAPMANRLKGYDAGWSGLMLVAGATGPKESLELREACGDMLFLVPGFGAQGASAAEALAGFKPGPLGLEGGVVNASRSVTFPDAGHIAESAPEWDAAIDTAINAAQSALVRAAREACEE